MHIKLHNYQQKAFESKKSVIVNAAGIQSGKSTIGSVFTLQKSLEINPDWNQIICAPTYKILTQASLPRFLSIAKHMGKYHKGDSIFKWHHGPQIFIRSLSDPNAMEGITDVASIWADEAGLFSRYAWENVMGRAAFREAPIMVTTTPYALNWLYSLWKDWKAGKADFVEFLTYSSIDNPYFPKSEFERQRKLLDPVRFAMKYQGEFGRMQGLVYPEIKFLDYRPLPPGTEYYGGIDWGFTNPFALTIRGITPLGIHYRIAEFYKSGLTTEDQLEITKARMNLYGVKLFVADPSNPGAIAYFNQKGVKTIPGNNDIVEGIRRHRALINEERFFIFDRENPFGYDEYMTYHYPEKSDLKIDEDEKEQVPVAQNNHSCDADRYLTYYLTESSQDKRTPIEPHDPTMPEDVLKRIDWLKKGGSSHKGY